MDTSGGKTELNELGKFNVLDCIEAEYKIQIGLD